MTLFRTCTNPHRLRRAPSRDSTRGFRSPENISRNEASSLSVADPVQSPTLVSSRPTPRQAHGGGVHHLTHEGWCHGWPLQRLGERHGQEGLGLERRRWGFRFHVPYCIFSDSVTPHPPFPSFVLLDENTAAAAAAVQLPAVRPMRACDARADVSVLSSHGCGLRPRRSLSGGEPEVTQLQYYCSVPKKVGKGKHEACVRVENPRCCSLRHLSCHRHLPVHRGLQREAEAGAPLLIGAPD